jgi:O-antigen/teichoic acid export membrane protein
MSAQPGTGAFSAAPPRDPPVSQLSTEPAPRDAPARFGSTRRYIRGSSLLLGGRFIAIALNLLVQVLTVRYLSKSDYGAFAYGLSVASMASSAVLLGLDKAVARFVPIYQERGDLRRTFGTIALACGIVGGLSLSVILLVFGLRHMIAGTVVTDPLSLSLLLILIALAPLDAFSSLLQGLQAIFVGARAIFVRRYLLGPGFKLAAVVLVILLSGSVRFLAWGYVVGGLLGVCTYVVILVRAWQSQGLLKNLRLKSLTVPAREVLGYSMPLLTSEVTYLLRSSLVVILLEYFQTTSAVAEYRAVFPIAKINLVVLQSFSLLFIPLASRLYAQNNRKGMDALYWQTTAWIAVLSFPIFAVTFSLAKPVTILLFGAKYADSAAVLAVLAVGHYVHAALGFNSHALRVYGKVRLIVAIDATATAVGLGLNLLLIPRYGAMGAAIATTSVLIVHNLCNHLGIYVGDTGIRLLRWRYLSVYVLVGLCSVGLLLFQSFVASSLVIGGLMAALASLLVIRVCRHVIPFEETFPELLRLRLFRYLFSSGQRP